jgi:hypothetical protein
MNLALTRSFCLQESDHSADLKLGIIFITAAILFACNARHVDEKDETTATTSPLPDVPIHASDIEMSSASHLKKTPWPESARELFRPSDRRLSSKLVPTSADIGCHEVSVTDPYDRILGFLDRSRYLFFQVGPQLYSRG